jgi:hypothetical protein
MWDAYGKPISAQDSGITIAKLKTTLVAFGRSILEPLFNTYKRRLLQGCYADGWVGHKGMWVLPNKNPGPGEWQLIIVGKAVAPNVRFKVDIRVNRKISHSFRVSQPGQFEVSLKLPASLGSADCFHIEFSSDRSFVPARTGNGTDWRRLAFLLQRVEVRCLKPAEMNSADGSEEQPDSM